MKDLVVSARPYDQEALEPAHCGRHESKSTEAKLTAQSAGMAAGFPAVCGFVNGRFDAPALKVPASGGTRLLLLRSAGFNNVDLQAAERFGIAVMRVSQYGHQGFFTREALSDIATATIQNLDDFEHARPSVNVLPSQPPLQAA